MSYEIILSHLWHTRRPRNREAYLAGLEGIVRDLRPFYENEVGGKVINFASESTRAAYLLTYFLQHSQVSFEALRSLHHADSKFMTRNEYRVLVIGGGPGPELATLCCLVPETSKVEGTIADLNADAWSGEEALIQKFCEGNVEPKVCYIQQTLGSDAALPQGPWDVIFCQNILNEIPDAGVDKTVASLCDLIAAQSSGSVLLIADRSKYDRGRRVVTQLLARCADLQALRAYERLNQHRLETPTDEDSRKGLGWVPYILYKTVFGRERNDIWPTTTIRMCHAVLRKG